MSILESMKADRKLSFKHWRYRLLHWCFNVENADPKDPTKTGLPSFLYTHYCPLFHLTNLIALLAPLILLLKVFYLFIYAVIVAIDVIPWRVLSDKVAKVCKCTLPKFKPKQEKKETLPNNELLIKKIIAAMWEYEGDYVSFWRRTPTGDMTKEQVELLWNEFQSRILAAREEKRRQKEEFKKRMIFWVNFSQVFIKWAMNVSYIGLGLFVAYLCWLIFFPIVDFIWWVLGGIGWMFSGVGFVSMLYSLCIWLFYIVLVMGFFYITLRIGVFQKFCSVCGSGIAYVKPPFYLFAVLGNWVADGVCGLISFVGMFYEENCPPIVLVSDEEAAVNEGGKK